MLFKQQMFNNKTIIELAYLMSFQKPEQELCIKRNTKSKRSPNLEDATSMETHKHLYFYTNINISIL